MVVIPVSQGCETQPRNSFLNKIKYAPFLYTNASINYQEEYRKNDFTNYFDLSSIILFKDSINVLALDL